MSELCLSWPGLRADAKRKHWRVSKTDAQPIDEKRTREKNWKWHRSWWGRCCWHQLYALATYAYSLEVTGQHSREGEVQRIFSVAVQFLPQLLGYSLHKLNMMIESQVFQQTLRGHRLEKVYKIVQVKSKTIPAVSRTLSVYARQGSELIHLTDLSKPKQCLTLKHKNQKRDNERVQWQCMTCKKKAAPFPSMS